ncbi:MAG: 16S rRNA (uracil(1498)-N(3))-methyltransferase [Chlamydiota bacterium]|nr:16S rRNA (uracil(1498)-N(3))-methyltransferase [Chlamydiota bacterium]
MPAYRYFSDSSLLKGQTVQITDQEFHHFARVMRGGVGDVVEFVDGKGTLAFATISKKSRRDATAVIDNVTKIEAPKEKRVIAQALPKTNRIEFILEKCTELGMTEIWLFESDHSEKKKISDNQLQRMHNILVSSMKQCGRLYLPKLVLKPHFSEWDLPKDCLLLFGDVDPSAEPLLKVLQSEKELKGALFFVGPESGFSDREVVTLREMGVRGVKLHKNILRTDTAPMVALSIIQSLY